MRPREDELIDPEIAEQLDAIDATLAGEPVDPRFAELAELALLLAVARPEGMRPEFGAELDRRVAGRFGRGGASAGRAGAPASPRRRRWVLAPVLGSAATALAAVVVAVVLLTTGGGSGTVQDLAAAPHVPIKRAESIVKSAAPATAVTTTATSSGKTILGTASHAPAGVPVLATPAPTGPAPELPSKASGASGSAKAGAGSGSGGGSRGGGTGGVTYANGSINGTLSPAPLSNGRKIVQSSMLQLGTPARRIDDVAQEVFSVVRAVSAIVESSNVSSTGGPGASAEFQLRVPSPALPTALSELSRLHYANVISRTDATHDVNSSYLSNERAITNAKATLVKLRAELAATTIQSEIASLRARIAVENALLSHAQSSLGSLNRRVDYSDVNVSVQATTGGGGASGGGGGFGVGKAGHDALRVLEVTAGVALIALAALVPLGLLVALAWWLSVAVQRRRRERALDLA